MSAQPDHLPPLDEPGDAELISSVRAGDLEAYGTLFERHVEAARRLARQLVSAGDVDDLVSEAFSKVLGVLQKGGGPDLAFRAYLLTSLRRLHVDKVRANARLTTTDDMEAYDPGVEFEDTAVAGFDNAAAARAFSSLPERWQQVLWHTEVEGQKPAEIAPLLGMSANSVSALAYRAREGLRQAFVTMHAQEAPDDACATTRANLGAYIRKGVSRRDATKIEAHLKECRPCTAIYLELTEVNSNIGALLAPLVVGVAAAPGYLAATGAAKAGVLAFFGGVKAWVANDPVGKTTAGVAAAAVVAGGLAVGLTAGHDKVQPQAKQSTPAASAPAPSSNPPADKPAPKPAPKPKPAPAAPAPAPAPAPSDSPTDTPPTAPTISAPIAAVTTQPGDSVTIDLTQGATDANGDPITVQNVDQPKHGDVKLVNGRPTTTTSGVGRIGAGGSFAFAPPTGATTVTYTPDKGWRGTDTITYTLTDGNGGTVDGSVDVTTPNAAPTADDESASINAGWAPGRHDTVTIDVLAGDRDENGDRLSIAHVGKPSSGSAKIRGGKIVYTAGGRKAHTDRFTYRVSDGHGGSDKGHVSVSVGPRKNNPPQVRSSIKTAPSKGESITFHIGDLATDPDGDKLTITKAWQNTFFSCGDVTTDGSSITYKRTDANPLCKPGVTDFFHYSVKDGSRTVTGTAAVTYGLF